MKFAIEDSEPQILGNDALDEENGDLPSGSHFMGKGERKEPKYIQPKLAESGIMYLRTSEGRLSEESGENELESSEIPVMAPGQPQ